MKEEEKKERGKSQWRPVPKEERKAEKKGGKWSKVAAVGPSKCVYLQKCH